jgi:hypothetical protein
MGKTINLKPAKELVEVVTIDTKTALILIPTAIKNSDKLHLLGLIHNTYGLKEWHRLTYEERDEIEDNPKILEMYNQLDLMCVINSTSGNSYLSDSDIIENYLKEINKPLMDEYEKSEAKLLERGRKVIGKFMGSEEIINYDSSWDLLMPVVQKLKYYFGLKFDWHQYLDEGSGVYTGEYWCTISEFYVRTDNIVDSSGWDSEIKSVFFAAVEYLNRLNK